MRASCQCGLIHFDAPSFQLTKLFICHCTQCRHQSSSAFGISAIYDRGAFERAVRPVLNLMLKDGDLRIYERPTAKGRALQCFFCSRCGCRVVHMVKGEEGKEGGTVSIKGGCLDGLTREMMRDAIHIWTTTAVVEIPSGAEQYEDDGPDD